MSDTHWTPTSKHLWVPARSGIPQRVDRRTFLQWSARSSLVGLSLLGAWGGVSACGGSDSGGDDNGGGGGGGDGELPASLKVGVIAPLSGIGQFIGTIVERSMGATKQHIDDDDVLPGTDAEYILVDAPVEQFAEGTTAAYNELVADPDVIGILWCTPIGLTEARAQVQRDQIPVIAVFADPYSEGWLYPEGPERNIFQMLLPDTMSFDAMCRYAAEDRGYASTALIYDSSTLAMAKDQFETAAADHDLEVVGVEEFQVFSGDYGAQLQRLKDAGPESLFVWGLADNTAGIVTGLSALDADYIDTPTAKSGEEWRPHILGYPGGTGEKKWAELAGDAAKSGSLTAWYLGGLVGGPQFPIRDWLVAYDGIGATGGEESAPNGWWALIEAVRIAGSTDRIAMVDALETLETSFAGLSFGFTADHHLGMTADDVVLISLERYTGPVETDPPYVLGREWEETFPLVKEDYVGPTHLVRPTLEANRKVKPDYIDLLLEEGWGTQCTKTPADAVGVDVELTGDCKIH